MWSTLVCKKMRRHLKRPAWLKRDLLSELKHQKKRVESGSKDGLHLEKCGSIDWVGRVELGKAIAHLETGEECEGSKKDFCRYIEKNIKESVGLMQNQAKSLVAKDNLCLGLFCQGLCLVGEFEGERYYPL